MEAQKELSSRLPHTRVELDKQRTIWNTLLTAEDRQMLRFRKRLAWGKLTMGSTTSYKDWIVFCSKHEAEKNGVLSSYREGYHMYHQVQDCIDNFHIYIEITCLFNGRDFFLRFEILLARKGFFLDERSYYFDV